MSLTIRPAIRQNTHLMIGMAGATGSGKTMSAMRLAQGIVGREHPFAVIDTEAGRALHYAPTPDAPPDFKTTFRFDHVELGPPFRSTAYADAIALVVAKGYRAIVIDSFSHEHDGEGGHLDWQEEELQALVDRAKERGRDTPEWKLRDALTRSSWREPKRARKAMVQRVLQTRAHLIFCLRAEDKIDFVKDKDGKTHVVPMETKAGFKGWIPICDKRFPFELTASFILTPDKPGVPQPIKLQEQHRAIFPEGALIDETAGKRIAAWASGGAKKNGGATAGTGPVAPTGLGGEGREPAAEVVIPPDEATMRASTLKAIEQERAKIRPSAAGFAKVAAYFCTTDELEKADVAQLDDLLDFLRKVAAGDPEAKRTLDEKILRRTVPAA